MASLLLAGISDLRGREVEPLIWPILAKPGVALLAYCIASGYVSIDLVTMILAFIPALVVGALFYLGWMGGADLAALLFLAVVLPRAPGDVLPFPLLVVIYTAIPSFVHRLIIGLRNCPSSLSRCMLSSRLKVKARDLLYNEEFKWWIVTDKRAGSLDVAAEPHEAVVSIVGEGLEEEVEATPGLPYVFHLAVAAWIAALLGDKPFIYMLNALLAT
ncbi:MAG: hypothetical protein GSR85_08225 [Desulfurococcales archaeon]|nr:hypothetical protein [Desulfurococcales archaeon]